SGAREGEAPAESEASTLRGKSRPSGARRTGSAGASPSQDAPPRAAYPCVVALAASRHRPAPAACLASPPHAATPRRLPPPPPPAVPFPPQPSADEAERTARLPRLLVVAGTVGEVAHPLRVGARAIGLAL